MARDYCQSIFTTLRRRTREVRVGKVGVGGNNPIRIQSMTTSDTRDVEATAEQIMRLSDYGCEIARVTVQGKKEADACEGIKDLLLQKGYDIPLVADIHFYPPAAIKVIDFVDKVRVNPGNYVDPRAVFKQVSYTDHDYEAELKKIDEGFSPLVLKCKKLNKSMRIGTNHGSLSDRIMNRFGDTPQGMVESALEFMRVCRKYDYHDVIFSMKASNPVVMIQAYRLLVAEMNILGWDYPLHLGVTEAGNAEDGRIKSSIGIGSLLLDGLGDTIRVSLTEDPWYEIDPCKRLVQFFEGYEADSKNVVRFDEKYRDFEEISKRNLEYQQSTPLHIDGSVLFSVSEGQILKESFFKDCGCLMQLGQPFKDVGTVDGIVVSSSIKSTLAKEKLEKLQRIGVSIFSRGFNQEGFLPGKKLSLLEQGDQVNYVLIQDDDLECLERLENRSFGAIFLQLAFTRLHKSRMIIDKLRQLKVKAPLIHFASYQCDEEDFVIQSSTEIGALLSDGLGEGVCLSGDYDLSCIHTVAFGILQGCRMRSFKTEYIACPSCGRTLFDLQSVTEKIKQSTSHLPGVKIAVMGCIVNGPGEMADADFGYVGSKPGMIDLYVGKTRVEKNIPSEEACERLIDLIKAHGRWVDPVNENEILEPIC